MRVGEMFLVLIEEGARLGMPGSATDTASAQAVSFTLRKIAIPTMCLPLTS